MTEADTDVLQPAAVEKTSGKSRLLAAFLSAAIPGTGHILLNRLRRGLVLLSLFVVLLTCFWLLRLLRFYAGFWCLYFCWIALALYASCSAHQSRRDNDTPAPSKWWFVLVIPVAIIIFSLAGGLVTRMAGFRSFSVPSASMENTILVGDRFVADTWFYRHRSPKRQEIILFKRENIFVIKRVIGVGGDLLHIEDGHVIVNRTELDEPYVIHTGNADDFMNNFGPVTVPTDAYFVMGDNRDVSYDSRSLGYGFVSKQAIIGSPLYVFGSGREGRDIR